jgi:hypothetical protein
MIMMEFIVAPLIVWICVSGVYSVIELFARRKERMYLIEKCGAGLDSTALHGKFGLPDYAGRSFSGLKIGCLLVGLGLGLLVGLMISTELISDGYDKRDLFSVAYAAPLLFFGGAGLIVSFLIEIRMNRKKRDREAN